VKRITVADPTTVPARLPQRKAAVLAGSDFDGSPGYFREEFLDGSGAVDAEGAPITRFRLVVSPPEATGVDLFIEAVRMLGGELLVLLKETNGDADRGRAPSKGRRYFGQAIEAERFARALELKRDWMAEDGHHQVMARCAGGNDYVVLDDHGLLFVYSRDARFEAWLDGHGIPRRRPWVKTDVDHLHCLTEDHDFQIRSFARGLGLVQLAEDA
jgi:hypothetical protein